MDLKKKSKYHVSGKVQRADLTCDVIRKSAPFVLSKLCILVADWSMRWSSDTFLIKLRLYMDLKKKQNIVYPGPWI